MHVCYFTPTRSGFGRCAFIGRMSTKEEEEEEGHSGVMPCLDNSTVAGTHTHEWTEGFVHFSSHGEWNNLPESSTTSSIDLTSGSTRDSTSSAAIATSSSRTDNDELMS